MWTKVLSELSQDSDNDYIMLDSTIVRAHAIVDTTVAEKNVAFPADAKLINRACGW